jgi:hypothetical protein
LQTESQCEYCESLGRSAWIVLVGERGAHCLACADLDHLAFLPPGNAALTRRAKKHSRRCGSEESRTSGRSPVSRQSVCGTQCHRNSQRQRQRPEDAGADTASSLPYDLFPFALSYHFLRCETLVA